MEINNNASKHMLAGVLLYPGWVQNAFMLQKEEKCAKIA